MVPHNSETSTAEAATVICPVYRAVTSHSHLAALSADHPGGLAGTGNGGGGSNALCPSTPADSSSTRNAACVAMPATQVHLETGQYGLRDAVREDDVDPGRHARFRRAARGHTAPRAKIDPSCRTQEA